MDDLEKTINECKEDRNKIQELYAEMDKSSKQLDRAIKLDNLLKATEVSMIGFSFGVSLITVIKAFKK